ncbi:MAG TPA: hypothetical protein VF691_17675, partial [Cytophagaceae bacterium]
MINCCLKLLGGYAAAILVLNIIVVLLSCSLESRNSSRHAKEGKPCQPALTATVFLTVGKSAGGHSLHLSGKVKSSRTF